MYTCTHTHTHVHVPTIICVLFCVSLSQDRGPIPCSDPNVTGLSGFAAELLHMGAPVMALPSGPDVAHYFALWHIPGADPQAAAAQQVRFFPARPVMGTLEGDPT
jgi:hypothetical protein